MARLKLITFDLDNTLWPVDAVIRQAEQTTRDWLLERDPALADTLTRASQAALRDQLMAAHPDYHHNLSALRRDTLVEGLKQAGYGEPEARRWAADAFEVFLEARQQVTLFPDVVPTLEQLAGRYQIGALTNGNASLARIGLDHLFGFQHSSESIGRGKPDAPIFMAALASAKVRADQVVHIGDHPNDDVLAARRQGFDAVWANLLEMPWPEPLPADTPTLRSFADLPALLEQLDV